jgi:hypothetical protein
VPENDVSGRPHQRQRHPVDAGEIAGIRAATLIGIVQDRRPDARRTGFGSLPRTSVIE